MSKAAVHNNKAYAPFSSQRVRPKDAIDLAKQDGVVYKIPCGDGKVFIGGSGRPTQERIKEHDRDINPRQQLKRFDMLKSLWYAKHSH